VHQDARYKNEKITVAVQLVTRNLKRREKIHRAEKSAVDF
jgi:hypothetical protein